MNLRLIRLTKEYETQLREMIEEWKADTHKTECHGCDTIHLRRFVLLYYVAGA